VTDAAGTGAHCQKDSARDGPLSPGPAPWVFFAAAAAIVSIAPLIVSGGFDLIVIPAIYRNSA
jgi:hypothetical protein